MTNVSKINPLVLPSVLLAGRKSLPQKPGVYFLLDGDAVLYIGQTFNLLQRLERHELLRQFNDTDNVRVAWLEWDKLDDLPELESKLIARFRPRLNSNFSTTTTSKVLCVTDGVLNEEPKIKVESFEWWAWLAAAKSFRYCPKSTQTAPFTARKEKGGYWYGYRKIAGKLLKQYIGKTEDLTIAHLDDISGLLGSHAISKVTQKSVTYNDEGFEKLQHEVATLRTEVDSLKVALLGKAKAR